MDTQTLFKAPKLRGYSKRFPRYIKFAIVQQLKDRPPWLPDFRNVIPLITTYSQQTQILKNQKQQAPKLKGFKVISAYR